MAGSRCRPRLRSPAVAVQYPLHQGLRDVAGDAWVLLQSADAVLVPALPVRHVDPHRPAVGDDDRAELILDAEQHLELVAVGADAAAVDQARDLPQELLVVGRDADVTA